MAEFFAGFSSLPGREREYRPDAGQGHFRFPHQEGEEAQQEQAEDEDRGSHRLPVFACGER